MDLANIPIILMVIVLFVILALFIVVKSLKLPVSYLKNEKARSEIRMRLKEKEYEEKQLKNAPQPEEDR